MKVLLSPLANTKLKYYIENINYEISGLGLVEKLENERGTLYVPDIFLFKQHVSAAQTTIDSDDISKFIEEKWSNDPDFPLEKVKLWWHSHVNMSVFWSGTDTACQDRLDNDQAEENWFLSIVGNKQGHRLAKVDIYQPHRMWVDNIQIEVGEPGLLSQIKAEIAEKVETPAALPPTSFVAPHQRGFGSRNMFNNVFPDDNYDDDRSVNPAMDSAEEYIPRKNSGIFVPKTSKRLKH